MEQKKVGTLTFHIANNYGAMLQAYALPIAVRNLGYDCEVIDYRFPYIYNMGHVEYFEELRGKYGFAGGGLRYIKRLLRGDYNPELKINKFDYFRTNIMPLSKKAYMNAAQLGDIDYDAVLFGSDQIWNSRLTGGIAKEFAGGFPCKVRTKKIAYAASCGRSEFNETEKNEYYPLLGGFKALGIRESGLCKSLEADGFNAKHVLDPTLLLDKSDWEAMVNRAKSDIKLPEGKYILVYVFDEDNRVYDFVDKLAEKEKREVCVIAYKKKAETEKYKVYDNCGPVDFVKLFLGAAAVVTTSFHGTAFSVIFRKDLYCIPHPTLHERTDSLLYLLEIGHRICSPRTDPYKTEPINWESVSNILTENQVRSLEFLKEAIG